MNPVGRLYYAASTVICVAHSMSEPRTAIGAQAGEARLCELLHEAGFTRVRRATETPFNLITEARPELGPGGSATVNGAASAMMMRCPSRRSTMSSCPRTRSGWGSS